MMNTWVTIKEIISRESKTNFPESFQINNVLTKDKTLNIIDKLKSKNSQSHDGLSSKL